MRNKILACTLLGLGFPLTSIATTSGPNVAVDIAPLHSLVSQVMDGVSKPDLIIPAEASPHEYALRPSQAKALSDADVVFWMGEGLTPWLEKALGNVSDSAQKVEMLKLAGTTTYEFREGATFEGHDHGDHAEEEDHHDGHEDEHHDDHHDELGLIDRFLSMFSHDHEEDHHDEHQDEHQDEHSGHDEHEGADPHAWLDPENAKVWLSEISDVLSKQDPANAKTYESNANKAIALLDQLINETQSTIDSLGELKFIVFHDAYQYFEKRFGISATGSISLGDVQDPSPARISEVRDVVKKLGVNCAFTEPQYDPGLVYNVFEGSSVTAIGVMDPLGANIEAGNQHYTKLIEAMTASLSKCKQ